MSPSSGLYSWHLCAVVQRASGPRSQLEHNLIAQVPAVAGAWEEKVIFHLSESLSSFLSPRSEELEMAWNRTWRLDLGWRDEVISKLIPAVLPLSGP